MVVKHQGEAAEAPTFIKAMGFVANENRPQRYYTIPSFQCAQTTSKTMIDNVVHYNFFKKGNEMSNKSVLSPDLLLQK